MVKKPAMMKTIHLISVLGALVALSGCNPTEISDGGRSSTQVYSDPMFAQRAFIYRDSPAIIGAANPVVNMQSMIDQKIPEIITAKSELVGDCVFSMSFAADCLKSFGAKSPAQKSLEIKPDGSWIFPPNSPEFYQVNGHYHAQLGIGKFFEKLKFAYDFLETQDQTKRSLPRYLPSSGLFWFRAVSPRNENFFRHSFLSNYTLCELELNASFSAAGPEICMGKWSAYSNFFMVQDPSIIYHELGHAFIAVMMNLRNGTGASDLHPLRSNLGSYGYDESGAIGEGISDYFSYLINGRPHLGEWGLKFVKANRPMTEEDPAHIPGIEASAEGRVSYPQFLLYNSNNPDVSDEDVHYAGQIISHYLVALTKSLQDKCSADHELSTSYVTLLLAETLAELGDLRAVGSDNVNGAARSPGYSYRFNNLDESASYVWAQVVNPPTFRKFSQAMAKNINRYITQNLCPTYTKDESEKLLDDYGLLLFRTYRDNQVSTKDRNIKLGQGATSINPTLRRKSVLISKNLLDLATPDSEAQVASYYIVDDQQNMQALLNNLLFKGYPMNLNPNLAGVAYNNSNIKISPGEILAIIPNLKNNSNSTMAGVHLLANDWDHVQIGSTSTGNFTPCLVDNVTTSAQGALSTGDCAETLGDYKRNLRSNNIFPTAAVAPVCMVQLDEGGNSRWVSQNEFRRKQGLSLADKDCLGHAGSSMVEDLSFNPHECLVRILPAANDAFFSKIDPQKSYIETMRAGNANYKFGPGNAIVMEVNKWIPPGVKFRCRLRAKFSNCSDCFSESDGEDFIDREYNGAKPFKIINLEFTIND
jgi:hypothetical protein